jgi:hypothetical protein
MTMKTVLVLVLASIVLRVSGQPTAPVGLLVNGVSNPLAISRNTTWFITGNRAALPFTPTSQKKSTSRTIKPTK